MEQSLFGERLKNAREASGMDQETMEKAGGRKLTRFFDLRDE